MSGTILSKDNVDVEDKQRFTEVLTTMQSHLVASKLDLSQKELKQLQSQSHVDSKIMSDKEDSQLNSGQNAKLHFDLRNINANIFHHFQFCRSSGNGNCYGENITGDRNDNYKCFTSCTYTC